ncbi:MAG: hypothetical protein WC845_01145 [Candidatus Staskawiczbacteria bacterium]|jgi:hypothetical protein
MKQKLLIITGLIIGSILSFSPIAFVVNHTDRTAAATLKNESFPKQQNQTIRIHEFTNIRHQ